MPPLNLRINSQAPRLAVVVLDLFAVIKTDLNVAYPATWFDPVADVKSLTLTDRRSQLDPSVRAIIHVYNPYASY